MPKKIEPVKGAHSKKGSKVESDKKPSTAQKATRPESKKDLGDKINKKLESLNIKTAKRTTVEPKGTQPAKQIPLKNKKKN